MQIPVVIGAEKSSASKSTAAEDSPLKQGYYPLKMVVDVSFVIYNWVYINQYLKAALLLPLVLDRKTGKSSSQASSEISQRLQQIKQINWIWYIMCSISIVASILIAIIWSTDTLFKASLVTDSIYTLLQLYELFFLYISIMMIRKALKNVDAIKDYVNERVMIF